MFDISCSLEIRSDDELLLHLHIGRNRSKVVQLSHPELVWYRFLMDNKLSLEDLDGYVYNAKRYYKLVDDLIDSELLQVLKEYERIMCKVELSTIAASLLVLIIVGYSFWLYVAGCLVASLMLIISNLIANRYYSAIHRYCDDQQSNFESRFREFSGKEIASFQNKISGKNGLTTECGPILQRQLPILTDLGR